VNASTSISIKLNTKNISTLKYTVIIILNEDQHEKIQNKNVKLPRKITVPIYLPIYCAYK